MARDRKHPAHPVSARRGSEPARDPGDSPRPVETLPPPDRTRPTGDFWFVALIFLAVFAAYQPVWRAGFNWNDLDYVTGPALRSLSGLARIWTDVGATEQYYPVLHSVFWFTHHLFGESAPAYHLLNVAVHGLNAVLLGLLLRRLGVPGARFAAALFALHPVMVESVAWIAELKNTLSALFYLSAALLYLRFAAERRARWYAAALGLFLLAVLSKTVAATLPGALLVLFWWRDGRLPSWRVPVAAGLIPFFALGAGLGLFTAWVERTQIGAAGPLFDFTLLERILIAGRAAWFYFGKLVWPAELLFFYPRWTVDPGSGWQYLFPMGVLLVLLGFWRLRRRTRAPLAAALVFGGTLFPVLGFFNVWAFVFSFVADHLQYLATPAVLALAGGGLHLATSRLGARAQAALGAAVLLGLAVLTWRQSRIYHDEETLYRATLARNPSAWLAQGNLGTILLKAGRHEEAVGHLRAALQTESRSGYLNFNLGLALTKLGRTAEAIPCFAREIQLRPEDAEARHYLGQALLQEQRFAGAVEALTEAARLAPGSAAIRNHLGTALLSLERIEPGLEQLREAVRLDPGLTEAGFNLGVGLVETGRAEEALGYLQRVVLDQPGDAGARVYLGRACLELRRWPEAVAHFDSALRLQPDLPEARAGLAEARRQNALAPSNQP